MKKEKIKYYDPELVWAENKLKNNLFILLIFICGFVLGFITVTFQEEKLKDKNYDQYVEIKNLKEIIYKYERGEF